MKVSLERAASHDLVGAAQYYDEQQSGLGTDFLDEVDAAIDQIGAGAERFGYYRGSKLVRSVRVARFPYRLLFVIDSGGAIIVAVAHLHRHPDFWKRRLR